MSAEMLKLSEDLRAKGLNQAADAVDIVREGLLSKNFIPQSLDVLEVDKEANLTAHKFGCIYTHYFRIKEVQYGYWSLEEDGNITAYAQEIPDQHTPLDPRRVGLISSTAPIQVFNKFGEIRDEVVIFEEGVSRPYVDDSTIE